MLTLKIPEIFREYADSAFVRFQYLNPDVEINLHSDEFQIICEQDQDYKSEILHLLYREKIYAETLDIRKELYKSFSND